MEILTNRMDLVGSRALGLEDTVVLDLGSVISELVFQKLKWLKVGKRLLEVSKRKLDQTVKINEELSKRRTQHVKALEHHENTKSEL